MPQTPLATADERAALRAWATVFDKTEYPTGGFEVCITLFNISEAAAHGMDDDTAEILRSKLKSSPAFKDPEIMADVRSWRKAYPRSHWWWWPEKL